MHGGGGLQCDDELHGGDELYGGDELHGGELHGGDDDDRGEPSVCNFLVG